LTASSYQSSAGTGTHHRTHTRSYAGTTKHSDYVALDSTDEATYTVSAFATSYATANAHPLQIMAGSSLNVYIWRIQIIMAAVATAATQDYIEFRRLTTAGTGGTAITPAPHDTTDAAAGATGMTLPTAKGTEGTLLYYSTIQQLQTIPTAGPFHTVLLDLDFDRPHAKPWRIAAGTSNGICIKSITAATGATCSVNVLITESNY
jgi:hypothetical protein